MSLRFAIFLLAQVRVLKRNDKKQKILYFSLIIIKQCLIIIKEKYSIFCFLSLRFRTLT